MKLEVISGQPDVTSGQLFSKLSELLRENGYSFEDKNAFLFYPEKKVGQQKLLYDSTRKFVKKHIEENKDFFILTHSDHVLNAVRVEIKKHNFVGGKVHQIKSDGYDVVANISQDGRLNIWVADIFDVWDAALVELF